MRILLVNTYYYPDMIGGTEVFLKMLAEELAEEGHEVRIICSSTSSHLPTSECKIGVTQIECKIDVTQIVCKVEPLSKSQSFLRPFARIRFRLKEIRNARAKQSMLAILDEFQPDVIHTNNLYGLSSSVWAAAKQRGIRLVHTVHDDYLMCPRQWRPCSYDCCHPKKGANAAMRVFCQIHRFENRRSMRFPDAFVFPSKPIFETFTNFAPDIGERSTIIPEAISFDPERVQAIAKEKSESIPETLRFVFVGQLAHQKGLPELLEAFSNLEAPDAELWIAGRGILEGMVEEACMKDGRIHFVGRIEPSKMDDFLSDKHITVCPTRTEEVFGLVVLEAFRNGMPVIATDNGGPAYIVKEGLTGRLVPPLNAQALEEAMAFYAHNKERVCEQARNVPAELERFSVRRMTEQYLRCYRAR